MITNTFVADIELIAWWTKQESYNANFLWLQMWTLFKRIMQMGNAVL